MDLNVRARSPEVEKCRSLGELTALMDKNPRFLSQSSVCVSIITKMPELVNGDLTPARVGDREIAILPLNTPFISAVIKQDKHIFDEAYSDEMRRFRSFDILERYYMVLFEYFAKKNIPVNFGDEMIGESDYVKSIYFSMVHLFMHISHNSYIYSYYCDQMQYLQDSYREYLQAIYDIYVPSENVKYYIDELTRFICHNFRDIVTHCHDYSWLTNAIMSAKVQSEDLKNNLSEVISAMAAIWDNMKYVESRHKMFYEIVNRENRLDLNDKIDEIVERHAKSLKMDPYCVKLAAIDFLGLVTNRFRNVVPNRFADVMDQFHMELHGLISDLIRLSSLGYHVNSTEYVAPISLFYNDLLATLGKGYRTMISDMTGHVETYWKDKAIESALSMDYYDMWQTVMEAEGTGDTYNPDIHAPAKTKKQSSQMSKTQGNIYKAYKAYKNKEAEVDSQISKAASAMKKAVVGDARTEIIEGRRFSALGLLKKLLGTVAIFSFSKIAGVIAIVVMVATKKKTTESEKKKILSELETELEIIEEKINDARGDDNRQAKYALMRTRNELRDAINRIRYNLPAKTESKHITVKGEY